MKKLIALMMCAMLLLSGCAAVTTEGPGTGFQIGDLVITDSTGETIDLTGLTFNYELAESDTGMGTRCHISAGDQGSADVIFAVVGQYLYLSLPGAEATHSYALDMAKVVQALSDAINGISDEIHGIIPAIFPGTGEGVVEAPAEDAAPEAAEGGLSALEDAMAGAGGSIIVEDPEAQQAMQEKLEEILNRCMTGEMTQINGEDFQVVVIDIGPDDMTELLDAMPPIFLFAMGGQPGSTLGQTLAAANVTLAMQCTVTGNQDFSKFEIDVTYNVTEEGQERSFNINIDHMAGGNSTTVSLSPMEDGQPVGVISMAFATIAVEDGSWLPAELGEDTVILTEMPLEQVKQVLSDGFDDYTALVDTMVDSVAQANQAG